MYAAFSDKREITHISRKFSYNEQTWQQDTQVTQNTKAKLKCSNVNLFAGHMVHGAYQKPVSL